MRALIPVFAIFLFVSCSQMKASPEKQGRLPASISTEDPFVTDFLDEVENAPAGTY